MTGPVCAVMCIFINTHTHIYNTFARALIAWTLVVLAYDLVRPVQHTQAAHTLFSYYIVE